MELILVILFAGFIWWLFQNSKASSATHQQAPEITVTVSSGYGTPIKVDWTTTSDNGFRIATNLALPITLYGLDKSEAEKLANALQDGQGYEIAEWFTHLVAQKNIKCKEIDDWLAEAKPQFQALVQKRINADPNWTSASELDKADMLDEFEEGAALELPVRPGYVDATLALLVGEPHDITIDDAFLERFKENPKVYQDLLYAISAGSKVQTAGAGDYRRKSFDELVEKGFMRRGKEIPMEDILASLTIKEMQEIAGTDANKKFTRKAGAIEFLMALPNLQERLDKVLSFRSLFQLKPIEGVNLEELAQAYAYSNEVARVILRTLRSELNTERTKESAKEWAPEEGWELDAENCCPSCRKQHGKKWRRLPQKLPPFHIGCECRLN